MKKSLNFLKIGKKIGSLTLVKKINPKPGHTNPRWICECECGKHKIIREDSIKQQKCKTSCGKCVEIKNIGESIVVKIEKNKITARCKCGNVFIRTKKILKSKNPLCNECNKKRKSKTKLINIEGKKFGCLFVLGVDESIKKNQKYWHCQCECGRTVSLSSQSIRSKKERKNCGKECMLKLLSS